MGPPSATKLQVRLNSKCDYKRLKNLFKYLPEDRDAPEPTVFEPQVDIINKVANKDNCEDELEKNSPLYIPYAGLTTICKNSIKATDSVYAENHEWETAFSACPGYKSYIDVCYLYELVRAVEKVVKGHKLG